MPFFKKTGARWGMASAPNALVACKGMEPQMKLQEMAAKPIVDRGHNLGFKQQVA